MTVCQDYKTRAQWEMGSKKCFEIKPNLASSDISKNRLYHKKIDFNSFSGLKIGLKICSSAMFARFCQYLLHKKTILTRLFLNGTKGYQDNSGCFRILKACTLRPWSPNLLEPFGNWEKVKSKLSFYEVNIGKSSKHVGTANFESEF